LDMRHVRYRTKNWQNILSEFKFINSGRSTLRPYYENLKKEKGKING